MVAQTNGSAMNGTRVNGSASSATGATRHASAALQDAFALAELQWQLLAADCRESKRRLMVAAAMLVVGLLLLIAALPVALFAVAELLRNAGFSAAASYAVASGGAVLIALAAVLVGWRVAKSAVGLFSRSRDELVNNIRALRSLAGSRGRAPAAESRML
jgi:uncharacterized membrane protein YqjE